MKNKGFTLVELIAVIVIIALVLALTTGIFIGVRKNILEQVYENTINDILTKAESYAKETGMTGTIDINVDFLIKNGYLKADDDKYIYDPRNKDNKLNCYMIHIILKDQEYEATLLDKKENKDGTCNENSFNTSEVNIFCRVDNEENFHECNGWYNNNLTLKIVSNNNKITEEDIKMSEVEYSSLNGYYELLKKDSSKEITVKTDTVVDTIYTALVKINDKNYTVSQKISVDKENPIIISKKLDVVYNKGQELKLNTTDLSGSGIKGYQLTKTECTKDNYSKNLIKITSSGKFNLCVMDNVGNITKQEVNISKITFNYNNVSSTDIITKSIYYMKEDCEYPLLTPVRNGYLFDYWENLEGNRVYDLKTIKDDEVVNAKWNILDVDTKADRIDKGTIGVKIENRVNLILVLDISGSMSSNSRLTNLKEVSNNLIDSMSFDVGSTISVISFDDTATTLLTKGTDPATAKSIINGLSTKGSTSFNSGLTNANNLITNYLAGEDNIFVIFVSDGYDNSGYSPSIGKEVKEKAKTVYSIGIGSDVSTHDLIDIASPDCYFNASEGLESLKEIFTKIQEEIREEVTYRSKNGLIPLPNLYVDENNKFALFVNNEEHVFSSMDEIREILTINEGIYNLDLVKIDNKYKLNGNLKSIEFTYYYNK